jgi:DNA-binding NtrC family response regulator
MFDISELSVLYVDDEPELREHVAYALRLHIENVTTAANGREALAIIRSNRPDVVISDIRMPVMDGLELATLLRKELPDLPFLFCTAFTDTDYMLQAIELGVAAYIPKPVDTERLLAAVRQAVLPVLQLREIERLKSESLQSCRILTGSGPAIKTLGERISQIVDSDYSVVITGEAGTGKSAVADWIHKTSRRKKKPLLSINCRNRSAEQLENELFGRLTARGRTPLSRDCGALHEIDDGTLLLDAPELLPLQLQERILDLLEQKSYCPTGSSASLHCDLRVIAVTSVDLAGEVTAGRFLQNLWLSLSDVVFVIPPLRERTEDIPIFCRTFLARAADDMGTICPKLAPEAIKCLQKELWPGNLRQLKQVVRRLVFHAEEIITAEDLKPLLAAGNIVGAKNLLPHDDLLQQRDALSFKLTDLEEWAIHRALRATDGKKMQAAELLGISYNAFKDKLKRYGT